MKFRRWKIVRQLRPNTYESRGRQLAKLLADDPEPVAGRFWSKRSAERHANAVSKGLILGEIHRPVEEWVWGHIDFAAVPA